jgi:hypothetical protein
LGAHLQQSLYNELGQNSHVGDIRGRGLFYGLEIVKDKNTKEPFHSSDNLARRIKLIAKNRGLLCYPMSGPIDGKMGDHVLLAPPFIISEEEIHSITTLLAESIDEALRCTKR